MSKVSKTARASAGMVVREVKVIPDEVYIKNLRIDLDSELYVAQEGARALLRAYDKTLLFANEQFEKNAALIKDNQALGAELKAALSQIETMTQELETAHTAALANATALVTVIEDVVAEKKEGDFIG